MHQRSRRLEKEEKEEKEGRGGGGGRRGRAGAGNDVLLPLMTLREKTTTDARTTVASVARTISQMRSDSVSTVVLLSTK